jgi:GrpB-like predicted nucleotidyltransferase (UPF0157 family)
MTENTPDPDREVGLIGGVEKREVVLSPYRAKWPSIFEQHRKTIVAALGRTALSIEHIGSTAVPGLSAKPIIDILVVVPNPADEASYLRPLEECGYELRVREPEFEEHRMFRTAKRDVHIHILSKDSPEVDRYLAFRNHLRNNDQDRMRYEELKKRLVERDWESMNAYADAKTAFIETAIAAARVANPNTADSE